MDIIKRNINYKEVTGNTINFMINLFQNYENLGYMTDFSENLITDSGSTVSITGTTENKLKNIRSYDYNNPYKVGVNGVIEVNENYVKYKINDIEYVTYLNDLSTTFKTEYVNNKYEINYFVFEENNIGFVDKIDIDNTVDIERQNISVIENFSKLRQITSVTEIEFFNNGFYKIFDQTI